MKRPNSRPPLKARTVLSFDIERRWPGAGESERWVAEDTVC